MGSVRVAVWRWRGCGGGGGGDWTACRVAFRDVAVVDPCCAGPQRGVVLPVVVQERGYGPDSAARGVPQLQLLDKVTCRCSPCG